MLSSRGRCAVLVALFGAITLTYVDRQILSVLKPVLKAEFGFDDRGYAWLLNQFTLCYAVMYPVSGWFVDRFGARLSLFAGLLACSFACIGAGYARSLEAFAFFRALLGIGGPVAFPAQVRVVAAWFPSSQRATANSICAAGGTFGAIVAPPLVAWLALSLDWRSAFLVPGFAGLLLLAVWLLLYRSSASAEQTRLDSEQGGAEARPAFRWTALWRTRSLQAILAIRFLTDPVWYFCLFWLPGYLQENSGLSLGTLGSIGWLPFLLADLGGVAAAVCSDRLVKRGGDPLRARKKALVCAAALAPVGLLGFAVEGPVATLLVFGAVGAVCLSWLFNLSMVIAESYPSRNVGSVLGIAGGFGAVGAMLFNAVLGESMTALGGGVVFAGMALLHPLAAVLLWRFVKREEPPAEARLLSSVPSERLGFAPPPVLPDGAAEKDLQPRPVPEP